MQWQLLFLLQPAINHNISLSINIEVMQIIDFLFELLSVQQEVMLYNIRQLTLKINNFVDVAEPWKYSTSRSTSLLLTTCKFIHKIFCLKEILTFIYP